VAALTPEELSSIVQRLNSVCREAQELSAEIKKKMDDTKRGDRPSADSGRAERRVVARRKR
jgi:hypothetical protein